MKAGMQADKPSNKGRLHPSIMKLCHVLSRTIAVQEFDWPRGWMTAAGVGQLSPDCLAALHLRNFGECGLHPESTFLSPFSWGKSILFGGSPCRSTIFAFPDPADPSTNLISQLSSLQESYKQRATM